ncbi:hypothetical protein COLO4_35951 [Corchorus olitorius]|uniref:Uncharacterized protein n=1 Tax=Corchorus olitorius TaxID=93759 RepID=A0A1R3GBP1_9ROSI|nr:hypothetical protein COLO4_35951 [Corchorus olitorius]
MLHSSNPFVAIESATPANASAWSPLSLAAVASSNFNGQATVSGGKRKMRASRVLERDLAESRESCVGERGCVECECEREEMNIRERSG